MKTPNNRFNPGQKLVRRVTHGYLFYGQGCLGYFLFNPFFIDG